MEPRLPRFLTHPVPGDGSCLFHALAYNLNLYDAKHKSTVGTVAGRWLRQHLLDKERWNRYAASLKREGIAVPSHATVLNPQYYANDAILSFLSKAYGLVFYTLVVSRARKSVSWSVKDPPIVYPHTPVLFLLLWDDEEHYQPLFPRELLGRTQPITALERALGIPVSSVWAVEARSFARPP
jgi:hypothetical protein